jgi:hypothetical protein
MRSTGMTTHTWNDDVRLQIFDQIYVAVIISLVGNAALFSIKKNAGATIAIIPLLVIAVLFRVAVARTFGRPMRNLSFHAAADLDRADRVRAHAPLAPVAQSVERFRFVQVADRHAM